MPIHEHPNYFFPDGNVVFFAGTGAFCLHRRRVNCWSLKFRNMLYNLENQPDPLTYKGHRVIELNECEVDFERLVRVMYEGKTSLTTECTAKSFPQLASILLLSQKYGIAHLFDHARLILLAAYPFTLASWDAREEYHLTSTASYDRLDSIQRCAPPLAVVSLAMQLDAPHLLVPAYLDLARLPVSDIIRGFTPTTRTANHPSGVALHLSPNQTTAVLRGKETLQRFIADFIKSDVESRAPAPHCRYHNAAGSSSPSSPCTVAFARLAHEMLVMTADVTGGMDSDPLFVLHRATEILQKTEARVCGNGACAACMDRFFRSAGAGRHFVWANLDKWFGLSGVVELGFEEGAWE